MVHAVDGVSLAIRPGETFAIVGESGCGKSTLGRLLLRLIEPSAGEVLYRGRSLTALPPAAMRRLRRELQIIFQDPFSSLNPQMTVGGIVGEPIWLHGLADGAERRDRVAALLRTVGLLPEHAARYPHEFSGGQRQRIGIARALAGEPELIVGDEPVSALDVSIQAQIINLLEDLKARFGLTLVIIAHDLAVIRHISDRVAVMYLGNIVEQAPVEALFETPLPSLHPGADEGDSRAASRRARTAASAAGRRAEPDRAAKRLPLPHPLPACAAALHRGAAPPRGGKSGPHGLLPFLARDPERRLGRVSSAAARPSDRNDSPSTAPGRSGGARRCLQRHNARRFTTMRGRSFLAFALGVLISGTAYGQTTFRIGLNEDPDVLDPHRARTFVGRIVFTSLCDKLIDITPKLEFVPQLATEWSWSDDYKTLTMKLLEGVTFHDGEPFDAAAVKANLDRARTLPDSMRKSELASVESVEVVDPMTVAIKLSRAGCDAAGSAFRPVRNDAVAEGLRDRFRAGPGLLRPLPLRRARAERPDRAGEVRGLSRRRQLQLRSRGVPADSGHDRPPRQSAGRRSRNAGTARPVRRGRRQERPEPDPRPP